MRSHVYKAICIILLLLSLLWAGSRSCLYLRALVGLDGNQSSLSNPTLIVDLTELINLELSGVEDELGWAHGCRRYGISEDDLCYFKTKRKYPHGFLPEEFELIGVFDPDSRMIGAIVVIPATNNIEDITPKMFGLDDFFMIYETRPEARNKDQYDYRIYGYDRTLPKGSSYDKYRTTDQALFGTVYYTDDKTSIVARIRFAHYAKQMENLR